MASVFKDCPVCQHFHRIDEEIRQKTVTYKGTVFAYEEKVMVCHLAQENNVFLTQQQAEENHDRALAAYEKALQQQ